VRTGVSILVIVLLILFLLKIGIWSSNKR
jgi:hypothetical protein